MKMKFTVTTKELKELVQEYGLDVEVRSFDIDSSEAKDFEIEIEIKTSIEKLLEGVLKGIAEGSKK